MRIEVQNVVKKFKSLHALDDVSLTIEPGQVVALLGANGAGKTTLLRCFAGIVTPDQGQILYDGQKFTRDRLDLRRRFFFLPDFPPIFEDWTPLMHIGMTLRLYGVNDQGIENRVVDLLRELDLLPLANARFSSLSRGQRYKAVLATLFAVNPEIWLLDEPFASGMDPHGINMFKRRAREAAAQGRTVIYTTQILDAAERFSDRMCVIHRAQVRANFCTAELHEANRPDSVVLDEIFQALREEDTK